VIQRCRARQFENIGEDQRGEIIIDSVKETFKCIAVHPTLPYLAIAGTNKFFNIWNYLTKEKIDIEYSQDSADPSAMEYTPDGECLIVGYSNGNVRFLNLDAPDLEQQHAKLKLYDVQVPGKTSEKNSPYITGIVVANDSKMFATMDRNCGVCLFKKDHKFGDPREPIEWIFTGKRKTHDLEVTAITFGEYLDEDEQMKLKLFSVGRDRRMFEYDVYSSTEEKGLTVTSCPRIEQEAQPTAAIWYPKTDSREDLLLTVNDQYKMKIWNVSMKSSRKTVLGPTYGGEIVKLRKLDIEGNQDKFLVYSTQEKVVGLIKLPLDGNPTKTMGLIAHPGPVVDICTTADGKYMFTTGGKDLAVNMWAIDVSPIDEAIAMGGEGIEPFINLIEGGRDGQTYQDMKDFFYYSMIRSKDENTTKTRKLDGTVPLEELPNLMRAMGHYPTEQEITNMIDEVRYSNFGGIETGEKVTSFDLDTFVRLFVNHRPVYAVGLPHIENAFGALLNGDKKGSIPKDKMQNLLQREGEVISVQDLQSYLF
jgi:WD40 repeat protein